MATSKIEQIIDEIEDYIDSCKFSTFSSTKILVNKEEIEGLLQELKSRTPDEIKRYQKIISNKEAIMDDARKKADDLVKQATVYQDQMVSEHSIMQQAYAQAEEVVSAAKAQAQQIIDQANAEASEIEMGAMQYTDDQLASIQAILSQSIQTTQEHNSQLIDSLSQILNVVNTNRAELYPADSVTQDEVIADRAEQERLAAEQQAAAAAAAESVNEVEPDPNQTIDQLG
ncbi:hypothetical protein SAMN05216390_102182 [Lachnospiraceae bacterium KH1T2]|nr:hypothetical protein SAMN05216390_102182 [Lachnospiraceae bacterium KH1T2]